MLSPSNDVCTLSAAEAAEKMGRKDILIYLNEHKSSMQNLFSIFQTSNKNSKRPLESDDHQQKKHKKT
jgi:hypothetical protein